MEAGERLRQYGLANMNPYNLSVFRIAKVLQQFEVEEKTHTNVASVTLSNKDQDDVSAADYFG